MDTFTALADPVRRELLRHLATGPARVVDLAAAQPISRPAISKHLRALSSAGLVTADDVGRERHYRIDRAGLTPVSVFLTELAPSPPFPERALDGLELEVRRAGRDRMGRDRDTAEDRQHTDGTRRTDSTRHIDEETA